MVEEQVKHTHVRLEAGQVLRVDRVRVVLIGHGHAGAGERGLVKVVPTECAGKVCGRAGLLAEIEDEFALRPVDAHLRAEQQRRVNA